jgi:DNA topoisomerase-1
MVSELKKESAKADQTILATDEDREGESIAWHLKEALKLEDPERIVFHEITKPAIDAALKSPRKIDLIGGCPAGPQSFRQNCRLQAFALFMKKVSKGLSAGRVQSVAVRLVVEKENEIKNFIAQEYWSVEALLKKSGQKFSANLSKKDGKSIDKLEIKNEAESQQILKELEGADYIVENLEKKETKKYPAPPFTTSTLQQAAWQRYKFSAKQTMALAQKLYEQGFITYHRTDSLNLSEISLQTARDFITKEYGKDYASDKPVRYKTKGKGAQEAHEAIRPTEPSRDPGSASGLEPRQQKLYTMIWQRFVACQMQPAILDSVAVDIKANDYTFRANGQTLKFNGFLKVYPRNLKKKNCRNSQLKINLNL